MKKPAFRNAMVLVLLALAAAAAWPQQLAQDELGTTAGRTFTFQTFQGKDTVIQSAQEIVGIGEVLWRTLRVNGKHGTYFGKYEVYRAFDSSATSLLGADILVIDAGARVNTLDNVQRVVAGYLAAAFGLGPAEAARVGALVTTYNAAHRGDIAYLSGKYTQGVMAYLTAANAGLALSYAEWPGKTRLVIPLGRGTNGTPSVAVTPGTTGGAATAGQAGTGGTPGKTGGSATSGQAGTTGTGGAGATGGTTSTGPAGGTSGGGTASAGGPGAATAGGPGTATAGGSGTAGAGGAAAGASGGTTGAPGGTGTSGTAGSGSAVTAAGGTGAAGGAAETGGAAPGSAGGSESPSAGSTSPGTPETTSPGPGGAGAFRTFLTTGNARWLVLLLLAAVLVVLFVVIRLLRAGLNPAWALAVVRSAREGHPLIEMVVTTQNRHIGTRNVHYLRPGSTATVGGGSSTFLVYFVPVPHGMATLTYDGKKYTFVPKREELFPAVAGQVTDCLGKPIPAQSTRGYKFTMVFHAFVSPLEEINRLMRSIRVPR